MLKSLSILCCVLFTCPLFAGEGFGFERFSSAMVSGASSSLNESLGYSAVEIPLPVELDAAIDSYGLTEGGHVFIVFGDRTAIKPWEEDWSISPKGFVAEYMAPTAFLAGRDFYTGQAVYWEPLLYPNGYATITAYGYVYSTRGLAKDGSLLLKSSIYSAADSLVFAKGNLTPFAELGFGFDLEGLQPVRLTPNGVVRGVYIGNFDTRHMFAIENDTLSIDDSVALSAAQVEGIVGVSESGNVLTRVDEASVELFGPSIAGIQSVDGFLGESINSDGYAVGWDGSEIPQSRALLWSPRGGLRDLNERVSSVPWPLVSARTILDDFRILALALDDDGGPHLFLLTVDPSFQIDGISVSANVEGEFLKVIAVTNFLAQGLVLQERRTDGSWLDLDFVSAEVTENSFLFEVPLAFAGKLLRVSAMRMGAN